MAGPDINLNPGDEIELTDAQAERFIDAGYIDRPVLKAEPVKKPKKKKKSK